MLQAPSKVALLRLWETCLTTWLVLTSHRHLLPSSCFGCSKSSLHLDHHSHHHCHYPSQTPSVFLLSVFLLVSFRSFVPAARTRFQLHRQVEDWTVPLRQPLHIPNEFTLALPAPEREPWPSCRLPHQSPCGGCTLGTGSALSAPGGPCALWGPAWLPVSLCISSIASSVPEEEQKLPEPDVAVFRTFLKQQASVLSQYPLLLPQQAANQPLDSPLCHQAPQLSQRWHHQRILRWLNKPNTVGGQQR